MRHYAEIGCLTLLGFTLTIYAAQYDHQEGKEVHQSRSFVKAQSAANFHVKVTARPSSYVSSPITFITAQPLPESVLYFKHSFPEQEISYHELIVGHLTTGISPSGHIRAGPIHPNA